VKTLKRIFPRHVTFDAHVHVMTPDRLEGGWRRLLRHLPGQRSSSAPPPTPGSLTQGIEEAGLKGFFNFFFPVFPGTSRQINEWNDAFCAGQPGAFPFLSLHPEDARRERDALMGEFLDKRQFIGVKIHSYIQRIRLDAEWLREVCAELEEKKRILFVHTGFSRQFRSGYREEEMADHLSALLEDFPELTVIGAHMFYPRLDIASRLLKRHPNLVLDIAALNPWVRRDGRLDEWIECCGRHAARILFGSDSAFIQETLAETIRAFEALPLGEGALNGIGGENALGLLESLGLAGRLRSESPDPAHAIRNSGETS